MTKVGDFWPLLIGARAETCQICKNGSRFETRLFGCTKIGKKWADLNQTFIFFEIERPDQNSMRRDELLETCRHWRKHLLVSLFKTKKPPDTTVK